MPFLNPKKRQTWVTKCPCIPNGIKIQFSGSVKKFILAFCSFVPSFLSLEKGKYKQVKRNWNLCLWGGMGMSCKFFTFHPTSPQIILFFLIHFEFVDQDYRKLCTQGLSLRSRGVCFLCDPNFSSSAFPPRWLGSHFQTFLCWVSETWVLLRFVPAFPTSWNSCVTMWAQELQYKTRGVRRWFILGITCVIPNLSKDCLKKSRTGATVDKSSKKGAHFHERLAFCFTDWPQVHYYLAATQNRWAGGCPINPSGTSLHCELEGMENLFIYSFSD